MIKTAKIIKHEFVTLVKRRGFIILTLVFPLLALSAIGIFQFARGEGGPGPSGSVTIGYVDEVGFFSGFTRWSGFELEEFENSQQATRALINHDLDEYIVIPTDYIQTGVVERYTLTRELEPGENTRSVVSDFLLSNLLEGKTSPQVRERALSPVYFNSILLDESGRPVDTHQTPANIAVPLVFGFLLVIAIGSSSGYLLQGLGEEKENRIMEILLSSVSTSQLLLGKILGLGAAGLVQIIVWLVSGVFIIRLAGDIVGGEFSLIQIPDNLIAIGIGYFILGYLFFAVIEAGIGAIMPTVKESQQMTVVLIILAILPFYMYMFFLTDNPENVLATALTLIPPTAPMMVFIRLGVSQIPAWELAVSVILLIGAIAGGLWISARLFRVFLLMYGKAPRLGEIIRQFWRA